MTREDSCSPRAPPRTLGVEAPRRSRPGTRRGRSKALKAASLASIVERPEGLAGHERDGSPGARYYGLGWSIEERAGGRYYAAHSGSLPGTSTRIVRGPDGRDLVLLLNARVSPAGGRLDAILEADLEAVFREVRQWPDVDLFAAFP